MIRMDSSNDRIFKTGSLVCCKSSPAVCVVDMIDAEALLAKLYKLDARNAPAIWVPLADVTVVPPRPELADVHLAGYRVKPRIADVRSISTTASYVDLNGFVQTGPDPCAEGYNSLRWVCELDLMLPNWSDTVGTEQVCVSNAALVLSALRNLERFGRQLSAGVCVPQLRWVAVSELFAIGSGVAQALCVRHGFDPDECIWVPEDEG
jgi:hypothetical protein